MTDIQLPDAVLDLFAAFDISDPAQILILLLGGILVLLLVLIILIAARGRPASAAAAVSETAEPPSALPAEQVPATTTPDMPVAPPVDTSLPPADAEDFRIFKRPKGAPAKPARPSSSAAADEQLSTTEHLRLIEKNMIRLRDLYQGGHITRDMYVDETRSLYHQARGLSSIS